MLHDLWSKLKKGFIHGRDGLIEVGESKPLDKTQALGMERRQHQGAGARYQADHEAVTKLHIPNINKISPIEENGEFVVTYTHTLLQPSSVLDIQVVPQEYSSYPSEHFFVVLACSNEIPSTVTKTLEEFAAFSSGIKIQEALPALSRNLTASIERQAAENFLGDGEDTEMTDAENDGQGSEDDGGDFEDFEFDDDDDHGDGNDDDIFGIFTDDTNRTSTAYNNTVVPAPLARIRRDFRTVRKAGFLISKICGFDEPTASNIISIAVQVEKLCLSEETLDAWNLTMNDYIVLLIRYERHYTTFAESLDKAANFSNIDFRLRKCARYKPTMQQALEAFANPGSELHSSSRLSSQVNSSTDVEKTGLTLLVIGESIDAFMNQEFVPLLKLRYKQNCTWDSAKQQLVKLTRTPHTALELNFDISQDGTNSKSTGISDNSKLPAFVANDHLLADGEISLPLIAVQFAMRYFVRCTDYCMVCHQQVNGNFEALKPYVCGDSLCLFQYMSMGFGPSIDLEVKNQPNVVDLLVSFCYAGLQKTPNNDFQGGLREYPTGLNLQVPRILPHTYVNLGAVNNVVTIQGGKLLDPMTGKFDYGKSSIILDNPLDISKIKENIWVVVVSPIVDKANVTQNILHHGCIEHITGHTVAIRVVSRHTLPVSSMTDEHLSMYPGQAILNAYLVLYDQSLDDADDITKAFAMKILLAATPPISSMREYLQASPNRQLEKWERLIPSASKLLRWIVASNRSFIVQVDELVSDGCAKSDTSLARNHERISGVNDWIQFRFAQGSPEKEHRFQEELKQVNKPQKTILGWHGSNLYNWHSIIRDGLDCKTVENGRSYGHGVYFGRDFGTSLGYSDRHARYPTDTSNSLIWPNSALKINAAVSLSEIVNRPSDFVNHKNLTWCYVVKHIHWIQCRYLFVRPLVSCLPSPKKEKRSNECEFIQDPQYVATGPGQNKIFVPKVAIPSAQGDALNHHVSSLKSNAMGHIEGCEGEDPEDIDYLLFNDHDNDEPVISKAGTLIQQHSSPSTPAAPLLNIYKTDFRPNTLDLSTLPQLAPPSYATSQGQKQIGHEIKKLQKVQSSTPVHELGWYINFEHITNMFHWIAELHSFDADLPLAKDMKKAGVSSIVLEIRFGREYPISPPFLRVVRPRFLPFGVGGGGHVTLGGAMCMELLTNSGWSPANSLESVLLQVRMALCSVDPRPARLESTKGPGRDYSIGEAYEAYTRAAIAHGWQIPGDLREATTAMMVHVPGNYIP